MSESSGHGMSGSDLSTGDSRNDRRGMNGSKCAGQSALVKVRCSSRAAQAALLKSLLKSRCSNRSALSCLPLPLSLTLASLGMDGSNRAAHTALCSPVLPFSSLQLSLRPPRPAETAPLSHSLHSTPFPLLTLTSLAQLLLPVSRGISRAEDPKAAAEKLRDQINEVRETVKEAAAAAPTTIKSFQTDFISFALSVEVLKFGTFTLKSGRISPYFFNAGLFADGQSLSKLGRSYAASIMASKLANSDGTVKFDVIFGPAYKGISLGAVVASSLYDVFGVDVGFAYNRKEAKDHGEGGMLVGAPMDGKKVLVVDDVISAGTAIRESHEMLVKINAVPVGVSIALDRAEKRR